MKKLESCSVAYPSLKLDIVLSEEVRRPIFLAIYCSDIHPRLEIQFKELDTMCTNNTFRTKDLFEASS